MGKRDSYDQDDRLRDAVAKYKEFHRLDPKKVGEFPDGFKIPKTLYRVGAAKWVTYRSQKVDPETLKKPRRPIDYIHEHDAGVETYIADPQLGISAVDVPERFRKTPALVRLGECLGFAFSYDGKTQEAEGRAPLPDLYTVPDGTCLLVIQSRRDVIAMMWGGGLGVFSRGIDG